MIARHQDRVYACIHTFSVVFMCRIIAYLTYFNVVSPQVKFMIQVIQEMNLPFLIQQIDIVVDIIILVDQLPNIPFT